METENHNISDSCPEWADLMIRRLGEIERQLGHLPNANEEYRGDDLEDMAQKAFGDDPEGEITEAAAEALFAEIVRRLAQAKFSEAAIATLINSRLTPNARLKYCDAAEVAEALGK